MFVIFRPQNEEAKAEVVILLVCIYLLGICILCKYLVQMDSAACIDLVDDNAAPIQHPITKGNVLNMYLLVRYDLGSQVYTTCALFD